MAVLVWMQKSPLWHARTYAPVCTAPERQGSPIGPLDTLIAAHTLSIHSTLVTHNKRECHRMEGLTVENWLTR
jgi:tRNA(fMet)-specific endonuclease VapC